MSLSNKLRRILHIAFIDLKLMVKDKMYLFWTLVFPLIIIMTFGHIYQQDNQDVKAALMVLNQDEGEWGEYFIQKLQSPGITITAIDQEPEDYIRYLHIPKDFSANIASKKSQEILLKLNENSNVEASTQVEIKIIQGLVKLITEIILHPDTTTFFAQKPEFQNILAIHSRFPENTILEIPAGFDHVIPGTIVMFIMMMVLIYGGVFVMIDRQRGIIKRIMFSSTTIPQLWTGKFLGRLINGLVQAFVLVAVGKLFFNLNLGNTILAALIILTFSVTIAALSIIYGSIFRKEQVIVGLSILTSNIFAALGGCWWPIEVVPDTIRTIGKFTPAYWAMDAFHQIIFFNRGLPQITPNLLILLSTTILLSLLSFKFFKIED
jgi:ABC-type multidrug transport system permease subunit